jgi:hypothetical protein
MGWVRGNHPTTFFSVLHVSKDSPLEKLAWSWSQLVPELCFQKPLARTWLSSQAAGIPGKAPRPVWGLVPCQWLMRTSVRGDTLKIRQRHKELILGLHPKWVLWREKKIFIRFFVNFVSTKALLISSSPGKMPS